MTLKLKLYIKCIFRETFAVNNGCTTDIYDTTFGPICGSLETTKIGTVFKSFQGKIPHLLRYISIILISNAGWAVLKTFDWFIYSFTN